MKPLVLILLAATASAQEMPRFRTWRASVAVLGAAQAADIASSYGHVGTERNPVFGQTFDGRDAALKIGIVAGVVTLQYIALRKHPDSRVARTFASINFTVAGLTAGAAVHNWRAQ